MAVTEPLSVQTTADPTILPFLATDFDPVNYLNSTLPTLSTSNARQNQPHIANLTALSAETQALLTRLSAQSTRLSNSLTQLTDEIIRSGGRLAYEVELLRGEAIGLSETLESDLKQDMSVFTGSSAREETSTSARSELGEVARLHDLTRARERLDAVIKVFDGAMKWPIAPSKLASATSSLITISAPATDEQAQVLESKAQDFARELEGEVIASLQSDASGDTQGTAQHRVDQMRDTALIWQGTSEEKARTAYLDDLQRLVDEKQHTNGAAKPATALPVRAADYRYGDLNFLQNLRK